MRISAKGEYAAKAVLYLSLRYPHVVTIHEVAEGHHIPLKYLEQILLALKNKGMLESRRGVHGGYMLARSPEMISVGEVLRAVDGSFSETGCLRGQLDEHYACPEAGSCGLRQLWGNVQETVDKLLFETTFAEVCRRTNSRPLADGESVGFTPSK
jgi:Rrf2 family transcriptional regulator, cysteine metabolism repressor